MRHIDEVLENLVADISKNGYPETGLDQSHHLLDFSDTLRKSLSLYWTDTSDIHSPEFLRQI